MNAKKVKEINDFVEMKWGRYGDPNYVATGIRKEIATWMVYFANEAYDKGLEDGQPEDDRDPRQK